MHTAATPWHGTDRKVDRLLAHYGESHRNPTNEAIHMVAIPAIMLSIVGPAVRAASLGGLRLRGGQPRLLRDAALPGLPGHDARRHGGCCWRWCMRMGDLVLPVSAAIFVVAWIFQFIGHKIEGKKPSFFEDIQYLWVGPLFVLSQALLAARHPLVGGPSAGSGLRSSAR